MESKQEQTNKLLKDFKAYAEAGLTFSTVAVRNSIIHHIGVFEFVVQH
jgi:hypothetical protein